MMPARRPAVGRTAAFLFACVIAPFALVACGGSKPKPVAKPKAPAKPAKSAYDLRCDKLQADYKQQVGAKRYIPASLIVHAWPEQKAGAKVGEADAVKTINGGGPNITLLMARGGLGKSKLGWALEAQTCATRATVRVDLHWDIAANLDTFPKGVNPLLHVIEKRLTGANTSDPKLGVEKVLKGRNLLLLFDSLDEVNLKHRKVLVDHIQAAMAPIQGTTAVVFTRPPVFSANYGFARISGRLEIPMLNCDATQRALRDLLKDDAKLANFLEFTKRYGLDRMVVRKAAQCYYPHMATYRDIMVLKQIADSVAASKPEQTTTISSRAKVYEFFLTAAVIKDLSGLNILPKDLMAIVDRMVLAQNPDGSKRNLGFTVGACLSRTGKSDAAVSKQICERLMQSTLFKETSRPDVWQFTNQSLGDLFLARWTNNAMAAKDGTSNCKIIAQRSSLFESSEVAGFLVGMENGQACLLPIVQELCSAGGNAEHNFELLDQGLPPANARIELLKTAQDAAGDAVKPDSCLGGLLERLKKTVPADAFPKEDAKKGKKKKKKKRRKRRKRKK